MATRASLGHISMTLLNYPLLGNYYLELIITFASCTIVSGWSSWRQSVQFHEWVSYC